MRGMRCSFELLNFTGDSSYVRERIKEGGRRERSDTGAVKPSEKLLAGFVYGEGIVPLSLAGPPCYTCCVLLHFSPTFFYDQTFSFTMYYCRPSCCGLYYV